MMSALWFCSREVLSSNLPMTIFKKKLSKKFVFEEPVGI
jgi:hypothetical protein